MSNDIMIQDGFTATQGVLKKYESRLMPVDIKIDPETGKKKCKFPSTWNYNTDFEESWNSKNSVALRTGGGVLVVDVDTKDMSALDDDTRPLIERYLNDLTQTLVIETTHGYHIYFDTGKLSDETFKNNVRVRPFIDVRSEGGCVFVASKVDGLDYSQKSTTRKILSLPTEIKKLLTASKRSSYMAEYEYSEDGLKVSKERRDPNPALHSTVNRGEILPILKATGMSPEDFTDGSIYPSFNKFAFILANEPSIENKDVIKILDLLIKEVLKFDPESRLSKEYKSQSLRNMIWSAEYVEPAKDPERDNSTERVGQIRGFDDNDFGFNEEMAAVNREGMILAFESVNVPTADLAGNVTTAGSTTPLLRIKKFNELSTKRIEVITLCGVPFPQEGLGMLAGNGGVGKSSVVIKLTISYLSIYPEERALLWFTEDHEAIIRERFEKQEVPESILSRIDFVGTQIRSVMDSLPAVMIELAGLCQGYGITVLDPLISFYSGEENDNAQARQFINQMTALSGLVILIHHSSKSGETSRGASDFRNGVRIAYRVDKPEIIYQAGKHSRRGDDTDLLGVRALILDKDNWDIAGQTPKTIRAHDHSGFMIPVFHPTDKHKENAKLIRESIISELRSLGKGITEVHTLIDMSSVSKVKKPDRKRGNY